MAQHEAQILKPTEQGQGPEKIFIGQIEKITTIPSLTLKRETQEFYRLRDHLEYSPRMIEALNFLLNEYNEAFGKVLSLRQPGAYPNAYFNGKFANLLVQVDVAGLPLSFLQQVDNLSPENLAQLLRSRMFEAENSLAMYNLMRGIFSPDASNNYSPNSFFGINFDAALELYQEYYQRPIVLGAVTPDKYQAMLATEFGIRSSGEEKLSADYVKLLSGFGDFVGPNRLAKTLQGNPQVVLYMRTSYPTSWLKNPAQNTPFSIPLLENPDVREKIREKAITPNVDDPNTVNWFISALNSQQFMMDLDPEYHFVMRPSSFEGMGKISVPIVNDTKEYLALMGYPLIVSDEQVSYHLNREEGFRLKPLWLHYGGYGHIRKPQGLVDNSERKRIVHELRRNLKMRGPYILQPEIPSFTFTDQNGNNWTAIHRLFLAWDPNERSYKFIGGLFNALPLDSHEAERGRIHGNRQAVWGQIVVKDPSQVVSEESINYISGNPVHIFK